MTSCSLHTVISGGQTGADRAGLEAAARCGLRTGGWAPAGFSTSSGFDSLLGSRFGLREVPRDPVVSRMLVARSKLNVDCSDATVAFRLRWSVGTDKTIAYCSTGNWPIGRPTGPSSDKGSPTIPRHRPCLVITQLTPETPRIIVDFVRAHGVRTLNVAGHRDVTLAECPDFAVRVEQLLVEAFTQMMMMTTTMEPSGAVRPVS